MAEIIKMNLHLFEGDGAGAAPGTGGGEGGEAAVAPGMLQDGTQVDDRLAARLEKQAQRRKQRGETPVSIPERVEAEPAEEPQAQEPSLEDQWNEAKKGKFREQYGRDVQAAVADRFKNQEDVTGKLAKAQQALQAIAKLRGLDENDLDGVIENILDDDSLYEEDAERMGMTVEGVRNFRAMEEENKLLKQREHEEQEQMFFRQHLTDLARQGEEMKKEFPNFDLMKELEDPRFRRMTAPNSGLDVRAAYYAIHHDELEPQAMAYGIQRAKQQISQTLQANRQRPVEGAMRTGQPADVHVDPSKMSREERQRYIERARRGEKIVF
jgi:hypothetical protein